MPPKKEVVVERAGRKRGRPSASSLQTGLKNQAPIREAKKQKVKPEEPVKVAQQVSAAKILSSLSCSPKSPMTFIKIQSGFTRTKRLLNTQFN